MGVWTVYFGMLAANFSRSSKRVVLRRVLKQLETAH